MDLASIIAEYGTQGIFSGLFIYTYLNNQKVSKEREDKYIDTINSFTDTIDELKEAINNMNKGGNQS